METDESETARLAPARPDVARSFFRCRLTDQEREQCELFKACVGITLLLLLCLLLTGFAIGLCVFVFETGLRWGLNPRLE